MEIRKAKIVDVDELARIEAISYPLAEAASKESILERIKKFSNYFWLLEDDGQIKAFINGMVTDEKDLLDEMYDCVDMQDSEGKWQMLFSVVTNPADRGKGFAKKLMNQVILEAKEQNRKGIVLTCKEYLLDFYGQFGFLNEGISKSTHGDTVWYQMRLTF